MISFIAHPYSSLKECTAWCGFCGNANGAVKLKGMIVWVAFVLVCWGVLGFFKPVLKQVLQCLKTPHLGFYL